MRFGEEPDVRIAVAKGSDFSVSGSIEFAVFAPVYTPLKINQLIGNGWHSREISSLAILRERRIAHESFGDVQGVKVSKRLYVKSRSVHQIGAPFI